MTEKLLNQILSELKSKESEHYSKGMIYNQIPTLAKGIYKKITPMLKTRFKLLDYLIDAPHGDWLSITEMEKLWDDIIVEERIQEIKDMLNSHIDNWENNAGSLFRSDRLSIFAISQYTNEHIYLLWLDEYAEPEIWVYDTNGEARYKNLDEYLIAYINDDLTAYERRWIL